MRAALPLLLALGACGDKPRADDTAADSGAPAWCDDAPLLTWANFGEGFVVENCQACHASTAIDRNGAPEDIVFDDRDATLALSDRILARAAGDAPSMPPQGGVTDEERERLEIWLTCWE